MSIFHDTSNLSNEDAMRETLSTYGILSPDQRNMFMKLFTKFLQQRQTLVKNNLIDKLSQPSASKIINRETIPPCPDDPGLRHELLDKIVIVKLNGGLGSTMGCQSIPKSALEVRNDNSFLDLSVKQVEFLNSLHGVDVPIILMNSFKTHATTAKLIQKYRKHNLTIHTILQNCYPRIAKTTLMPIPNGPFSATSSEYWYPPGHGDIYYSMWSSGVLDSLLQDGKEYAFISNIDNLCATIDMDTLYHLYCNEIEMAMEVTNTVRSDTDGGYLVEQDGKLRLVELVEVPQHQKDDFRKLFTLFNTNNIWINLRKLKQIIETGDIIDQVIAMERQMDFIKVLQLETTAGSAIIKFQNTLAIHVERVSRFMPVKTTADLMLIQSDIFSIKHGALSLIDKARIQGPLPLIKLGPHLSTIDEYQKRIQNNPPNIIELEHLTISGNVYIGAHTTFKGTVIIIAADGDIIMIPDGTILQDKVVTGNLRILDH